VEPVVHAEHLKATGDTATGFVAIDPSYTDSFRVSRERAADRSGESWMRSVLEGAPRPLRWFVAVGWRTMLGFRPGPAGSPAHVLGWPILTTTRQRIVLEQRSALMTARLTLHVNGSEIVWTTEVRYEHRAALAVWPIVRVIHRRIVPYALRHAASRAS
jgi:hypothetical protein